ncbi:nitroreductase [Dethiosulfatarculus sandiegensis]|uniref:Nitroreductase n=1 Tax=Dethiosulfatarculus sandiegensis TaxID=1429043 RepID=A0A0D2JRN4_9BACT|nr:nitroreductase [Dethiosulfatarculus sandiegensis]
MDPKELLELIKTRHSVRRFTDRSVDDELLGQILEAGRWAPSGKNNQSWRFVVIRDQALKLKIAELTASGRIIKDAPVVMPVFIHEPSMYDQTKDHQSIGACLENMLIMAHGAGLGAVWLGEILKNAKSVRELLNLGEEYRMMAVLALGWPMGEVKYPPRKTVDELVLARY